MEKWRENNNFHDEHQKSERKKSQNQETTKTVMQKIDIIFKIICPILAF